MDSQQTKQFPQVGAVAIGRNDGDRIVRGLPTLTRQIPHVVYADSGSVDGSPDRARALGVHVVAITQPPHSAARGRQAGFDELLRVAPDIKYVHFIDGDCTLEPTWLETAVAYMEAHPKCAALAGRRREEFPQSGLGATVYKIAGKWDPVDWLSVRGSFGTNYATPPASFIPGQVTNALSLIANAGNRYLRVETETLSGVEPETAEVANFGAIVFFSDLPLNGSLRASADYFDFTIIDEIKTVSHNGILNTVFVANPGTNNPINCSAPLIDRITFINGQGAAGCTQGTTTGNDVTSIRSVRGNGPGANTSGIDYDITYSFEALGGDMSASVTATNVLAYEIDAFVLNGTPLTPAVDGLGFANYSRDGDIVSEWRGNASLNYSAGNHNLRYVMRYIQGVTDDRFIGTANEQIDDFVTSNLYYQYTMPFDENFVLSFSVENLMDEDPPFTVQQYSYDPFIGNPLGRTYEIGLRKTF